MTNHPGWECQKCGAVIPFKRDELNFGGYVSNTPPSPSTRVGGSHVPPYSDTTVESMTCDEVQVYHIMAS